MGASLVESTDPNDENIAPVTPDSSYCAYTNNGETDKTRRKIFFSLAPFASAEGLQRAFNVYKNIPDMQTVDNLGDSALWNPNNNSLVVAAKGRYQLYIIITQPEGGGLDKAKAAANVIIPRL